MEPRAVLLVFCLVLSVSQLIFAQPPFPFHRPRSWGSPNEIHGNLGPRIQMPGVLIAGHAPPGPRPPGPVHPGMRQFPLPSTAAPSVWPSHGPQIQRAKETSHFEYEVFPLNPPSPKAPPTVLRPAPNNLRPVFQRNPQMPPELMKFLAEESVPTAIPSPRPVPTSRFQPRTDRPPVGPLAIPTPPGPTSADFQEGYRILTNILMEDAGGDLRNNLIGGSEISFNGGYYPIANLNGAAPTSPQPIQQQEINSTAPSQNESNVEIAAAQEQPILDDSEQEQSEEVKPSPTPPQMEESESIVSYGPPHFRPGRPSHVSFMFGDPEEGPGGFTVHDNTFRGPPPPFHPGGNSIRSGPTPPSDEGKPANQYKAPPQNGGYQTIESNSIRSSYPGKNAQRPLMMMPITPDGNVNGPQPTSEEVQMALSILSRYANKQATQMGINPHVLRQQQQPQFPQPTSYGAPLQQQQKQASPSPQTSYGAPPQQQQQQQKQASPSPQTSYGVPPQQEQQEQQASPQSSYQVPPPTQEQASTQSSYSVPQNAQSTSQSSYLPSSAINAPDQQGPYPSGPSSHYGTTEATSHYTPSVAQTEETSPFPVYGPPSAAWAGNGGWSSGGGSGGGIIGAKVEALKTIKSAVAGGFKQITGLKAGIFNAGLSVIGNLGNAKGDLANSLKIPVLSKNPAPVYGAPSNPAPSYGPPPPSPVYGEPSAPAPSYGPPPEASKPSSSYGPPKENPAATLINGVKDIVGAAVGTVAQTGRAAIGITLSKNDLIKNHFAIKGQAFTDTMSKKFANKNQYLQNVLKHIESIFDAATAKPGNGWKSPSW